MGRVSWSWENLSPAPPLASGGFLATCPVPGPVGESPDLPQCSHPVCIFRPVSGHPPLRTGLGAHCDLVLTEQ